MQVSNYFKNNHECLILHTISSSPNVLPPLSRNSANCPAHSIAHMTALADKGCNGQMGRKMTNAAFLSA